MGAYNPLQEWSDNVYPCVTRIVINNDKAIQGHGAIGESSEDILHFILVEDYVHPCISWVIINNDEAIEASSGSKGRVVSRAK